MKRARESYFNEEKGIAIFCIAMGLLILTLLALGISSIEHNNVQSIVIVIIANVYVIAGVCKLVTETKNDK